MVRRCFPADLTPYGVPEIGKDCGFESRLGRFIFAFYSFFLALVVVEL
jgi:hypothetical protein